MQYPNPSFTRRDLIKSLAAGGAVAALPAMVRAAAGERPSFATIIAYLQTHRRDDDGYGWEDQEISHLTPTFGVIGCYHLMQQAPPDRAKLAHYVRTHHPREVKKLEQERRVFEFQQVQALTWLGEDVAAFRETVGKWIGPLPYLRQYEQHGYPVFQSELGAILSRPLLGIPLDNLSPKFTAYLDERRRPNGSFNNTPAADGSDGHVMNTWWGLQALRIFGRHEVNKESTSAWLRSCQLPNGGFTYQPKPEFGGVDDVAYTRAAVRALESLGSAPANRDACMAYLHSLANADGGFSDRPGWRSNPLATFCALDALAGLSALPTATTVKRRAPRAKQVLPGNLKIFTIQVESHGQGSPTEAVDLARALKIDWWGAKNATPEWHARVREIAAAQKVPVTFFPANEEYGTWVDVPGLGTYSHVSDLVAPPDADIGPALATRGNTKAVTWPEFRTRRLAALEKGQGRLVWQFGENEELVRTYLDDSVERGGFAAISTYHFGNPDFTNSEPFLHRWRGQLPYIALQDAHGTEPWWFADMTTGFRTVFLATEPTWAGWLNALKQNWTVPIRRDVWTRGKTWMHSGSREVLDFVRARESSWRWWDNPAIARPMVSIVAVRSDDLLEPVRPKSGTMLRVRCAWENTPQGLLKQPISELVRLSIDGREVTPELDSRKRPNGLFEEHSHQLPLASFAPGKHTATAVVRVLATKIETTRTVEFSV